MRGLFTDGVAGKTNGDTERFRDLFLTKIKAVKLCNIGVSGCWPDAWYTLSKTTMPDPASTTSRAILADGSYIYFDLQSDPDLCTSNSNGKSTSCGTVAFDVNGSKAPNTIGKDILGLWVEQTGKAGPIGTAGDIFYANNSFKCDVKAYPSTNGWNCSAEYLYK